jgi:biofilm PGA synthesis N-glycosyltransferase PgaC
MLDALDLLVTWVVGGLGVLSLVVLGAAALYLLSELFRQKRALAFGVATLLLAVSFTPPGVWVVSLGCAVVVAVQSLCYLGFAARTLLRRRRASSLWAGPLPDVTVIVPAKDEEVVIEATLRSLDALDYPRELLHIVLIDDGSTDATQARARAVSESMRHAVQIVHFDVSAGKARRLNALVRTLDTEFVLLLDADHWVEVDLVQSMLNAFGSDREVACVQVGSQVRNGSTNALTRALEMEYLFRCKGIYRASRSVFSSAAAPCSVARRSSKSAALTLRC